MRNPNTRLPRNDQFPLSACDGKSSGRQERRVLLVTELTETFQPEQPTRLRLDRQAPIDAHENPGDGLLNRLSDFPVHATAKFFRQPLEVKVERRG